MRENPNTGNVHLTVFLASRPRPPDFTSHLSKLIESRRRVAQGEELRHTYVVLLADRRVFGCSDEFNSGPQGLGARTRHRAWRVIFEDGPLAVAAFASPLEVTTAAVGRHLDLLAEKGAVKAREFASAGQPDHERIRLRTSRCAQRTIDRERRRR